MTVLSLNSPLSWLKRDIFCKSLFVFQKKASTGHNWDESAKAFARENAQWEVMQAIGRFNYVKDIYSKGN